jgi:hypothetical protein
MILSLKVIVYIKKVNGYIRDRGNGSSTVYSAFSGTESRIVSAKLYSYTIGADKNFVFSEIDGASVIKK